MSSKRGLGKGLDALLMASKTNQQRNNQISLETKKDKPSSNRSSSETLEISTFNSKATQTGFLEVSLDSLKPGRYQPRREMQKEALEALAGSIRAQGIIQPIVVKKDGKTFEIIAGERRWRAAELAGLKTVPIVIKDVKDETAMAMALIENIQRAELNALEEAMALERLAKEFGLTHAQIAESIGRSRVSVTNSLRLLSLGDDVKKLLEQGKLEAGHAKVLLGLRGHLQSKFALLVAEKGLSVRETERLVLNAEEKASGVLRRKQSPAIDPDIRRLQQSLSEKLGAQLEIAHTEQGKGKLIVYYNSLDELDGILEHIK